jgi:hypothetical protein
MAITEFPIQTVNLSTLGIGQLKFVSNYASLAAAISSIGATPTTLIIDEDTTVSTAVVIPDTLTLAQWNQSVLTKSGSGTIEFEGLGLQDLLSQQPIFSGFAAGDITWTGTDAPAVVSAELWNTGDASLTGRLQRANDAFPSKYVKIIAYPRTITGTVTFSQKRHIHFTIGDYPTSISTNIYPFVFDNEFTATADAGAIIHLAAVGGSGFGVYSSEVVVYNITIDGLHLKGADDAVGNPANSNLIIGNAHNGTIRNCVFENSLQYTVVGGSGATGNFSKNCLVQGNKWINCSTQSLAVLSSKDTLISGNYWDVQGITTTANATLIDVEPNDQRDVVENITIHGNVFDMRSGNLLNINAIALNAVITQNILNATVSSNQFIGEDQSGFIGGIFATGINGLRITDNTVIYGHASYDVRNSTNVIVADNASQHCGDVTGRNSTIQLYGVHNAIVRDNNVNFATAGIYEQEKENAVTASASTVISREYGFYDFWVGLTFLLNDTTYTVATVDTYPADPSTQELTTTVAVGTLANAVMSSRTGDTITVTAHGFNNAAAARYVAGTSAIGGLTDAVTYYIIKVTNDTFKVATTRANALANTPITLSSSGTGTQTFKPILQTRFSNNKYIYNVAEFVTVEPTGTSEVAPIVYA